MRFQTEPVFPLQARIIERLDAAVDPEELLPRTAGNPPVPSVVLLLLGALKTGEPCLILNKRSAKVRQPGDLCCPGGSIEGRLDACLSRLLRLPGTPLNRWPRWRRWRHRWPGPAANLSLYLATALREAAEEMRLNPLGVRFLGPMRPQRLVMFHRVIHPMAAWAGGQQRFWPNWEVARIFRIPLRQLLDGRRYARYRLRMNAGAWRHVQDFACFRVSTPRGGRFSGGRPIGSPSTSWKRSSISRRRPWKICQRFSAPWTAIIPPAGGDFPAGPNNGPVFSASVHQSTNGRARPEALT